MTRKHLGTAAWKRRRAEQIKRVPRCEACGSAENLQADHVVAVGAGGSEDGPLRTLCATCNQRKNDRPMTLAELRRMARPKRTTIYASRRSPSQAIFRDPDAPAPSGHTFPVHDCHAGGEPIGTLIGDYRFGTWSGSSCPPGCTRR